MKSKALSERRHRSNDSGRLAGTHNALASTATARAWSAVFQRLPKQLANHICDFTRTSFKSLGSVAAQLCLAVFEVPGRSVGSVSSGWIQ